MRRRFATLTLLVLVLGALVGGTVAFASHDQTVNLTVDGRTRAVHSAARTVGAVLAHENIDAGPHDIVAPSADAQVHDGDNVVIRFGRRLVVNVDGRQRVFWVTAQSVQEALDQIGMRADRAYLSVSRSLPIGRQGLDLTLLTPRKVTVLADGHRTVMTTTTATVKDLLVAAGVTLRVADRVSVPLTTFPREGGVVTVTRIDAKRATVRQTVDYPTVHRRTSDLYEGSTKVDTSGSAGVAILVYVDRYIDHVLRVHTLTSRTVTTRPVARVILVGTKNRPAPQVQASTSSGSTSSHSASADGLNWAALARCESGGNPRAVNPSGRYFGLYQFSTATWQAVGGAGNPADASSGEQTYRAQILYRRSGAGQWPVCGRNLFS